MMTSEDIRQLLQRFYDGETTHAEEHSLREWFRTNDCPEDLQPDRQMVMAGNGRRAYACGLADAHLQPPPKA